MRKRPGAGWPNPRSRNHRREAAALNNARAIVHGIPRSEIISMQRLNVILCIISFSLCEIVRNMARYNRAFIIRATRATLVGLSTRRIAGWRIILRKTCTSVKSSHVILYVSPAKALSISSRKVVIPRGISVQQHIKLVQRVARITRQPRMKHLLI